jgi:hypothetical protein
LYEIQVRQSSAESDRHRVRSKQFFYGMLCAQAGVTIATLAIAVRRQSLMWGLASAAGLCARYCWRRTFTCTFERQRERIPQRWAAR